jgi:hypothetical protein
VASPKSTRYSGTSADASEPQRLSALLPDVDRGCWASPRAGHQPAVKHARHVVRLARRLARHVRELGYELLKRVTPILGQGLDATRVRLVDIYSSST